MPNEKLSVCPICGSGKPKDRLTCSVACRNRMNARKPKKKEYPQTCKQCGKDFISKSPRAGYCSPECHTRYFYLKYIERSKERDRIKVKKVSLGLNIRDETMRSPTREAKWLWDGIGKWSTKYWPDIRECLECNTNVYKHAGNGICERCYDKFRYRDEAKVKKWKEEAYKRNKEAGKPSSGTEGRQWIDRARKKEIPITPKIENILDNLDRLKGGDL